MKIDTFFCRMCNSNKDRTQFDTYYTNGCNDLRLTYKACLLHRQGRYQQQRQQLQARRLILPQNILDVNSDSLYTIILKTLIYI